ncbi:hypothetical protein JCM11957_02150 [Caminibacter profundus]
MRIFFVLFLTVFAFAEIRANLVEVYNNYGKIDKKLKKGTSGIVLCPYEGEKIICARAVANGNLVDFYTYDTLRNDAFALPVVVPKKGDEVVFEKDYNRIMIIAPNQEVYLMIRNKYKNAIIISPDILASFIDGMPDISTFRKFAIENNIVRYIFVIGKKLYEVDSFSFYVINSHKIKKTSKYNKAFFTYFNNFDIKTENIENYYLKLIKK